MSDYRELRPLYVHVRASEKTKNMLKDIQKAMSVKYRVLSEADVIEIAIRELFNKMPVNTFQETY